MGIRPIIANSTPINNKIRIQIMPNNELQLHTTYDMRYNLLQLCKILLQIRLFSVSRCVTPGLALTSRNDEARGTAGKGESEKTSFEMVGRVIG